MTSTAPRKRPSLALNTVAQSMPLMVGYLASFFSAPFVLTGIGLKGFGTWALTGALAQYAGLLDFGVGPSLSRFVAVYDAEGRDELIAEVLGAGFFTSTVISAVLAVLSISVAAPVAHSLGSVSTGGMRLLLLSATAMFTSSNYANVLFSHKIGLRQMVAPNVVLTVGALINFVFSIGSALVFRNVVSYALANAAASALTLALAAGYSFLLARPRLPVKIPRLATVRELTNFSLKRQVQTAAELINNQTDKIVIALFIGPGAAGAYELANRVAFAAQALGVYSVSAMVPTLASDMRGRSAEALQAIYLRWTQRSTAISAPTLLLAAVLSPLILGAWLGRPPHDSTAVLTALALSYVLLATTGVGFTLAYALGYPGLPARSNIAAAGGNIILTAGLAPLLGVWGVLIGTAIAVTAGSLYQVKLVHAKFDIPLEAFWRAILPPLRISAMLAVPIIAPTLLFLHSARWERAVVVCLVGVLYAGLYVMFANRAGLLPDALSRRLPGAHLKVRAEASVLD